MFNLISEFDSNGVIVNELNLEYVKRFVKWMQSEKKLSDGVIKMILSKVGAITNYAISKGLMNGDDYPFKEWHYKQKFKTASKLDYIHWKTLDVMKEMLMDDIIVRNGNRWSYKDEVLDELMYKNSALFARFLFMEMVLWQGLAPVDICHILKSEIDVKTIGGKDYYCWDGKRHKTMKGVKVRIPCHTVYTEVMVKTMLMFNQGEWFLPVLNDYTIETSENSRKPVRIRTGGTASAGCHPCQTCRRRSSRWSVCQSGTHCTSQPDYCRICQIFKQLLFQPCTRRNIMQKNIEKTLDK
jgi:hypothetical protein